jgi:hypothetical protein
MAAYARAESSLREFTEIGRSYRTFLMQPKCGHFYCGPTPALKPPCGKPRQVVSGCGEFVISGKPQ